VRVEFAHAEGLRTADGGPVQGFALAGQDREWHWAEARIEGEALVLSAEPVPEPVAVRYAWADNPPCNLENAAGLPAVPFRTDDWPGTAGSPGESLQEAYPPPDPVSLPRADHPIEVDGELCDWQDVPALPRPHHGRTPGAVKLAWREDGLYGAVHATSGPPRPGTEQGIGLDSLELWVDKALDRTPMMTAQTSQYVFSPAAEAGAGQARVAAGGDVYRSDSLSCAWRPTQKGYDLEFHVPAELLEPAAMEAGQQLGLNFTLNVAGEPAEHFFVHKETDGSWCTPVTWGIVRLAR
jgi:hypothetical protein